MASDGEAAVFHEKFGRTGTMIAVLIGRTGGPEHPVMTPVRVSFRTLSAIDPRS
jgi:hypothetical protein